MNNFYVYIHRKKTNGECFYVGKGMKGRFKSKHNRNQYWKNIVNKHGFDPIIIVNNISEEKAFELESNICEQIGYENLCNIVTLKGWGGYVRSEETKIKQSLSMMGKTHTEESKMKMSNSHIGLKYTDEVKKRMNLSKYKSIIQYDLNGEFIKEWNSIKEASEMLKINRGDIGSCCQNKKYKTAGGFKWKYKNE